MHTIFETDGAIATLTFNRPEARNAMTWEMYEALVAACEQVDGDAALRVLIVRGAGGKAFVAGTDIGQFTEFKDCDDGLRYERDGDRLTFRVARVKKPVIAQIEGFAVGGGLGIAAGADLRVATPESRFGAPIARTLGNCLSMSNISRLVSLIGPARTKDLIFKARLVEAPEALALGLLNEVVPDVETLQRRADETAKLVAGHAPITLEVTKEAVRRIRRTLTREEGEDLILRAYMSEDFREGMDAFLNKRAPNFKGK
jgi:enoyl-CoA hydratase/carnithine racemase